MSGVGHRMAGLRGRALCLKQSYKRYMVLSSVLGSKYGPLVWALTLLFPCSGRLRSMGHD